MPARFPATPLIMTVRMMGILQRPFDRNFAGPVNRAEIENMDDPIDASAGIRQREKGWAS